MSRRRLCHLHLPSIALPFQTRSVVETCSGSMFRLIIAVIGLNRAIVCAESLGLNQPVDQELRYSVCESSPDEELPGVDPSKLFTCLPLWAL